MVDADQRGTGASRRPDRGGGGVPRSGDGHLRLPEHAPHGLVAHAEVSGQGAQALGGRQGANGGSLAWRQAASAITLLGSPSRRSNTGTSRGLGDHHPGGVVTQSRERPPSLPPVPYQR